MEASSSSIVIPAPMEAETTRSSVKVASARAEIRHVRFTIPGVPGPPKHCIIVPHDRSVTQKEWPQILKLWKLSLPNLLIQLDSGSTHSKKIINADLAQCPDFQKLLADLDSSAGDTPSIGDSATRDEIPGGAGPSCRRSRDTLLPTANEILHNRLIRIMEAVANAADQTNSWILSTKNPTQAELLLEEAMANSNASPVVLVIDQIDRTACADYFAPAQKFMSEIHEELSSAAVPLGSERTPELVELKGDLWDPSVNDTNKHFVDMAAKHGRPFALWEFESVRAAEAKGHPWSSGFFRSGTHYILFQSAPVNLDDDMIKMAHLSSLGSVGHIFLGGGPDVRMRALEAMHQAKPSVLVANTGRATQQWSILVKTLKESALQEEQEIPALALKLEQSLRSGFPTVSKLSQNIQVQTADVWDMLDVYKARPEVFSDTIAVTNPLVDSPEHVLNLMSKCFASQAVGSAELGVGSAQIEVVLEAWRIHAQLHYNARRQEQRGNVLFFSSIVLSFLTTTVSVMVNVSEANTHEGEWFQERIPASAWNVFKVLCLILPALGGIVTSVMARFRVGAKSSVLMAAAARVVTEIYTFRTRTCKYNPSLFQSRKSEEDMEGNEAENAAMAARRARLLFVRNVQAIHDTVIHSDMIGDHLVQPSDNNYNFAPNSETLRTHVARNVLNVDARLLTPGPAERNYADNPWTALLRREQGTEIDDFVSPISTEAYMHYRVMPLFAMLGQQAPSISRKLKVIDVLIFIMASVSTLLAALECREWIPVAVAFSTLLTSSLIYLGFQGRLEATNVSIGNIQNLITFWRGMGVVDRRMPRVREHIVSTLEAAFLSQAESQTSRSALLNATAEDDESQEGPREASKKRD